MTIDYNLKRKQKENDKIFISAVGPNIILISAIGEESKKIGIDILNRCMVDSYKYLIKNTRVSNYTKSISSNNLVQR